MAVRNWFEPENRTNKKKVGRGLVKSAMAPAKREDQAPG